MLVAAVGRADLVWASVLVGALVLIVGALAPSRSSTTGARPHAHQMGNLGVDHRKLAMWTFLGSECLLFGTLIATYLAYAAAA